MLRSLVVASALAIAVLASLLGATLATTDFSPARESVTRGAELTSGAEDSMPDCRFIIAMPKRGYVCGSPGS